MQLRMEGMLQEEVAAFVRSHPDGLIFPGQDRPENLITNNVLVVTTFPTPVWEQEARRLEGGSCRTDTQGRGVGQGVGGPERGGGGQTLQ